MKLVFEEFDNKTSVTNVYRYHTTKDHNTFTKTPLFIIRFQSPAMKNKFINKQKMWIGFNQCTFENVNNVVFEGYLNGYDCIWQDLQNQQQIQVREINDNNKDCANSQSLQSKKHNNLQQPKELQLSDNNDSISTTTTTTTVNTNSNMMPSLTDDTSQTTTHKNNTNLGKRSNKSRPNNKH